MSMLVFGWIGFGGIWNKMNSLAQNLSTQTNDQKITESGLTDFFSESFNQNLPSQTVTKCENNQENCVFLISTQDGDLYFGDRQKQTYDQGEKRVQGRFDFSGDQGLQIPENVKATLKLNHKLEVEKGLDFDKALVIITDQNDSKNTQTIDIKTTFPRNLEDRYNLEGFSLIDISKFDGKKINLSFVFDTFDGSNNKFFGWQIFDFQILGKKPTETSQSSASVSSSNSSSQTSSSLAQTSQNTPNSSTQSSVSTSSVTSSQSSLVSSSVASTEIWNINTEKRLWAKQAHENFPNISNLWQVQNNSNQVFLKYGSDKNYDDSSRNGGSLISPDIVLSTGKRFFLQGNSDLKVEDSSNWDRAKIFVLNKTSGEQTGIWNGKINKNTFLNIDLSPFAGQTIQLVFSFDTIDRFENSTEGWQVSGIKIVTTDEALGK